MQSAINGGSRWAGQPPAIDTSRSAGRGDFTAAARGSGVGGVVSGVAGATMFSSNEGGGTSEDFGTSPRSVASNEDACEVRGRFMVSFLRVQFTAQYRRRAHNKKGWVEGFIG